MGPAGGDRAEWTGRKRASDHRRQETIGGEKGFRSGKRAGVWTDGEPTARECGESKEKLERATLGSASRGMKWGGARERPQKTGQGNHNRTDNMRKG